MKARASGIACCFFILLFISSNISSQVPVEQELHHKPLFTNQYISLLRGHVLPGDTTLMHTHAANSVVVFLTKARFGIQNIGEKASIAQVNAGDIVYRAYGDTPVTHIVWEQGIAAFDFLVVEILKHYKTAGSYIRPSSPGVQLKWENKSGRAYTITLLKGQQLKLPPSGSACLLIDIDNCVEASASTQIKYMKPEDVVYYPPNTAIIVKQCSTKKAQCILLELK